MKYTQTNYGMFRCFIENTIIFINYECSYSYTYILCTYSYTYVSAVKQIQTYVI